MSTWKAVENFSFEAPEEQYSFVTRLAYENSWTIAYTELALLEYKKFMYLASISNSMVTPSKVIDIVWHQHLIFSKSYDAFCSLLGKRVQHTPSTNRKEQAKQFEDAHTYITELYKEHFNEQPSAIWSDSKSTIEYSPLAPSKKYITKLTTLLTSLIISTIVSSIFIRSINNPYFLFGFWGVFILIALAYLIGHYITGAKIYGHLTKSWTFNNLNLNELVYLKTNRISYIPVLILEGLLKKDLIKVDERKVISPKNAVHITPTKYESLVLELLNKHGNMKTSAIVKYTSREPLIKQTKNTIDRFKDNVTNSKIYNDLSYSVYALFGLTLGSGIARLISGLYNDKPIGYLGLSLIVSILIVSRLYKFISVNFIFRYSISKEIQTKLLNQRQAIDSKYDFFLYGSTALLPTGLILLNDLKEQSYSTLNNFTSNNSHSSFSSSSDNSCGSGCGGCGD